VFVIVIHFDSCCATGELSFMTELLVWRIAAECAATTLRVHGAV